ncbi:hypothetical protein GNY06_04490 [Elizabethkingia argentiflava]|uniref:RHS repeat-associated core domain-containing protein n=1 Tax=Elizabethkingia argenteiflava TaxID=2681556 RepID=A0A845PR46_9FLAO|nr:hypothetical protein [Elizabethkingia argenteiflava]NAW50672.1 hypothetical protein [Elizabethkingia argenteiflava]
MWLSTDPLAEKFPGRSPYEYTFNNPTKYIDPDGREPIDGGPGPRYTFNMASFISSKTTKDPLGRVYAGDARGPSLSVNSTARGRAIFSYNTDNSKYSVVSAGASITEREGFFTYDKDRAAVNYNINQKGNNLSIEYSTKNPLTPQLLTPEVNVNANISTYYDKNNSTLSIVYTVMSDGYPSTESFISDSNNIRIFLGVKKEQGTPVSQLPGNADTKAFSGMLIIGLDDKGNFKNILNSGKIEQIKDHNESVIKNFGK